MCGSFAEGVKEKGCLTRTLLDFEYCYRVGEHRTTVRTCNDKVIDTEK